jgi:hypothetical protein
LKVEEEWIEKLNSAYPFGLNDRIKSLGDINKIDIINLDRDNTPYFKHKTSRGSRSHGHRKPLSHRPRYNISQLTKDIYEVFFKIRLI